MDLRNYILNMHREEFLTPEEIASALNQDLTYVLDVLSQAS